METRSSAISDQINYKQVDQFAPRYKYVKINMSNILGNTVSVTATGTTQVQFKMPYNTVFNLAKSKLATLIPIGTPAGYSRVVADCWPFGNQTVSFETGNGLQLLNLPESSRYTKIVTKYNTSFKDYICKDVSDCPHSCNTTVLANNFSPLGTDASAYSNEPQYYYRTANNASMNVPIMYELGNFKHTILSLVKDLYFGQNDMYLKYTIGGVNNWAFLGTGAANPVTGAATLNPALTTLQNVYLYLAVEQNPVIIDNLVKEYHSRGLRFLIEYPFVTKTTAPATTNQAIVIPFVPAQGKFLRRVYHTVWNATESLNTALDCENSSAVASGVANTTAKVLSYNTYLDSTKLQDDIIVSATAVTATAINADDWRINQPFCRDSAITSYSTYQRNWAHIDDFCNPDMLKNVGIINPQNVRDGLPMERGIQFQFIASTASDNAAALSLTHDNFAIFSREILADQNGVQFI